MPSRLKKIPTGTAVLALIAVLLFGGGAAVAADAAPAAKPHAKTSANPPAKAPAAAPEEAVKDPKAMEILLRMAGYMAKATNLGVTVLSSYDAIQEDGEYIEFGDRRRVELQRPNRLRIDVERSDGDKGKLVFDGKALTVFKPTDNVYAAVEKAGTVDDVLVYVVKDMQVPVPLARLFTTTFPQQLEKMVREIAYVETDRLFDVPTDHLAVRGDEVDFQVWVSQGDTPLPRRIIITYKNDPGAPQFRALLNDWTMTAVAAESFAFTPPAGAEKVPLIVPEGKRRPSATPAPAAKGGAK